MLRIKTTSRFQKDFKRMERRGKGMSRLRKLIECLVRDDRHTLLSEFRDHPLKGSYQGFRECHIEPNWLLVYRVHENNLVLTRTGTHSDLFE